MTRAGSVMYELGMRVSRENRTPSGLQQQVNCFLSALNCLRLIRPEYAWIVQPAPGATYERAGASPKRNSDGEFSSQPVKRQVDILELRDLEREFILSSSRLSLSQLHPSQAAIAGGASAGEMSQSRVRGAHLQVHQAAGGGEEPQSDAWSWLAANQLSAVVNTKESSAADEAWRLLSSYLLRYPCSNGRHHRCVINKLLSHGVPLPDWLIKSYKEVDAASLLRLYLNFDLLEEAGDLVLEYVDALLGRNRYYGLEGPLSATSPSVWLPYTSIDQLLQTLNETQTNSSMYDKVRDRLEDYHRQVEQTTRRRLLAR
ncbi:hypothetical protein CgunFtcFv8_024080 [Champsocephalus gunnari]|uniref:Uncharacterized protein n=1 Tax=Champsocephalus gunnari TaxID=52237 RepID=A0AAN8DDP8_CHAGU|nr:hypothetical protein CgunFtcFv8_024080 [Champsocephalus gunnari]